MPEESYTVADPQSTLQSSPSARATLVVYFDDVQADGHADRHANAPAAQLIELPEDAEVTFGRSRSATVRIESERVSRVHARLIRKGTRVLVEDLDSRNGTRIDGQLIAEPSVLAPGDELSIGPVRAVLSMATSVQRSRRVGTTWTLDERLAAETNRGQLYGRRFILVMLRLDGEDDAVDGALARLVAALRPMDTIVEYGPDEFAILVPETDLEQGIERARDLVRVTRLGTGHGLHARVGLAAFPDHGVTPGEVLARACDAVRKARVEARDDVVVSGSERRDTAQIVIADPQMHKLYNMVRKVAATNMTVLICGETGAGKEVVAEAIHRASPRSDGPFVCVNCACITDSLLESELFGHERGAFTGADRQRAGYFEAASGGTLFLDEIGEITPPLQAKLLRVLERQTVTRVGGTKEIPVDTRVICATNRDLHAEVQAGRFRSDLFFRTAGFVLMVPPLRDRPGEVPLLAQRFLERAARELGVPIPTLSSATMAALRAYHWPGNVRELRNAVERALVLQTEGTVEPDHLPERMLDMAERAPSYPALLELAQPDGERRPGSVDSPPCSVREHVAEVERASIVAALEACGGNQTQAARQLGISRRSLIYRMEKFGLKALPASRR